MKYMYFTMALMLVLACEPKEDKKSNKTAPVTDVLVPLDTMGGWVKIVVKDPEGALRGVEVGDVLDSVTIREKATVHEQNPKQRYITYTLDIDDDFVDIAYHYDEQKKIKAIRVNATVNGVESFLEDFGKFFTLRYGAGKKTNDTLQVWQSKKGYSIKMTKKLSESGAKIVIE